MNFARLINSQLINCILFVSFVVTEEERRARNAPVFLVKLNDTELLENTYLRFMVKVKGEPMPTVQL